MNAFDLRIREALRHSLAAYEVPPPPNFLSRPISSRRVQKKRWLIAVAAAILLGWVASVSVGRTALAQLANAITQVVKFFQIDARGLLHPVASQSLSLAEALQTEAFHVVAPAGLPPNATVESIQRLGTGTATTLIFAFDYRGRQFSIVETPANSQSTPNVGYLVAQPVPRPSDRVLQSNHGTYFRFQATVWISGSARIALFAADALAPDEVWHIERAMTRS